MQLEHDEISLNSPYDGSQTSTSYDFAAENPRSPVTCSTVAIVQAEFLQNRLCVARQTFEFVHRLFRRRQFYQFNFFKLMLPVDAARVATVAAGL